ncbi:MAG TPA: hypothetical protein VIG64_14055 [Actinomycetota bacterium]
MRRRLGAAVAALLVVVTGAARAAAGQEIPPDHPSVVARFPYVGGTEIAFSGRYAYATQMDGHLERGESLDQGGIRIFDIVRSKPRLVGFLHCPGNDNDVVAIEPGLVALGYHENRCAPGQGMVTVDVSNPRRPRVLGHVEVPSSHTITAYPGKPIVYVSPGGLAYAGGPEQIVDVSNPRRPEVVATYSNNPNGCHDVSFRITKESQLAFCAGLTEVQVWDVSDPLAPVTIAHIVNPAIQYPHYAQASPDGKTLVVNDEAFVAHECVTGQSPTGAFWTYDISDPAAPALLGKFSPPRGEPGVGNEATWVETWCTSHQFSFTPNGNLVMPWFTGGTSLINLSDPAAPRETAYYAPEDAIAYSSQFRNGHVYINDMNRGFEVLRVRPRRG